MGIVNGIVTGFFDVLLWPFRSLAPIWGLTVVSFLTGILMLWIFGKVSNQDGLKRAKDRAWGNITGLWLFGDDLGLLFKMQGRIFANTFRYMGYAVPPLLILLAPVLLIMAQLNLRYGFGPLEPGRPVLFKVYVRDAAVIDAGVDLEVPPGVTVETPAVRIPVKSEVDWRIRVDEPGDYLLKVHAGDQVVEKRLRASAGPSPVPTQRNRGFWGLLLYPGESPIETAAVRKIEIQHAVMPLRLFGWDVNSLPVGWLLFFLVASIVFGLLFRKPLGVEV